MLLAHELSTFSVVSDKDKLFHVKFELLFNRIKGCERLEKKLNQLAKLELRGNKFVNERR